MADFTLIREILTLGNQLKGTLEEEFIALSEKNLDHLETVQVRKVSLLESIQAQWPQDVDTGAEADTNSDLDTDDPSDPLWDEARSLLNECKEAHIRNDLLLKRQLEVVRTVLSSLTQRSADNHSALYDKMGRVRRKR
ncbi:MAG: flagellar protein FlgN [Pseudomonadota bacterium]|nr:flagellar protein FlgN [Pseudomonadota bacterium]MEC8144799.1 flagellar protein FlgN [Pseudomonadota bacterium]MEC8346439.1 flagellar protein FlgN [Pseudomonadota bacterium]MEC8437449.1 flagellar protein FlgN [Pseudomonadota bacterium]MEC8618442.1 flagellar protein FlgN [Pseudomonadota bacterium]